MIKQAIKKVVKTVAVEVGTVDNNKVKQLRKVEIAFKRAYKVNIEVKYVDAKYKEYITRPTVHGYHNDNSRIIVVFITGDKKRNTETLLHELTHAYQAQHMNRQFKKSKQQLNTNQVSYKDSWHETHARHTAHLLVNTFDFTLDISSAMEYTIAA